MHWNSRTLRQKLLPAIVIVVLFAYNSSARDQNPIRVRSVMKHIGNMFRPWAGHMITKIYNERWLLLFSRLCYDTVQSTLELYTLSGNAEFHQPKDDILIIMDKPRGQCWCHEDFRFLMVWSTEKSSATSYMYTVISSGQIWAILIE